jgi:phospholipid-translocating ATPase
VSPKQKGAVVRLIKREEKAITLAIGDGANDCPRIPSADIGIAIRGLEGLQAFNVCDYGITQFRFLQNLLLVHGRWCYRRVATVINYTFYKNVVLAMPQYWMGTVSSFSGQKLYNDFMYQMFNVVHSMLPIMLLGVLDQDVSRQWALKRPQLYALGRGREYLNLYTSGGWMMSGAWHAFVVFFVPYYTMSNGNITHADGKANDIWLVGAVVYLGVVIVVNLRCVMETTFVTWMTWFGVLFSMFFWLVMQAYFSGGATGSVVTSELHGTTQRIFGCPMIWMVVFTVTVVSLTPDVQWKGVRGILFPSVLHKVQEEVLEESRSKAKPLLSL